MGTRDLRELRILVLLGWLLTRALSSPSPEWREGGSELLVGACYSRWGAKEPGLSVTLVMQSFPLSQEAFPQ